MPGILGIIQKKHKNRRANENLIKAMLQKLSHNDNYISQAYAGDWFAIGNIGLPIEGESRFTIREEGGYAAAFSGYIYGWKNLDDNLGRDTSDKASRLIDIYQCHKDNLPTKINGSFNIAVVDINAREFLICNDRFGHRQLYYYEDNDLFLFSTEIKAFLAYDKFIKEINFKGVSDYFNYSFLLGDKTFFKGVKILRGGHNIIYKNARITFQKYWDYQFGEESKQTVGELIEEADSIYTGIIQRLTHCGDNIIIPLSGGLDSRFIVGHTVRAGFEPYCFSHGTKNCREVQIAGRVASTLGLKHFSFVNIDPHWLVDYAQEFVYLTEGMVDTSACLLLGISAQYNLSPEKSVFLNGIFGGPTNFGEGYFREQDIVDSPNYYEKLQRIRFSLFGEIIDDWYYALFSPELRPEFKKRYLESIDEEFRPNLEVSDLFSNQKDIFFIKNRLFRYMNLVDCNRFLWHDHFALADDTLVDFYMKLPSRLKLGRRFFIEYFKAKFPDLARITYLSRGTNLYRKPAVYRKKIRNYIKRAKYIAGRLSRGRIVFYDKDHYVNQDQWFRTHKKISRFYQEILLDNRTIQRGYYDKATIKALIDRQNQGGNSFLVLASLLAFELFNRTFVDK